MADFCAGAAALARITNPLAKAASPSAICRVVEVVGAFSSSAASVESGRAKTRSAARPRALSASAVMATRGMPNRLA